MKLYLGAESGNSWKVRILLDQLGVECAIVEIDIPTRQHKSKEFMAAVNPRGQVPVLEDNGRRFWDSGACLVYLARKHNRLDWLPIEPAGMAEVLQWVFMAETEIQFGLQYTRRGVTRGRWIIGSVDNKPEFQSIGRLALTAMETQLRDHNWLALDRITIADIACYPYTYYAHEADLPLHDYPAIRGWLARCQSIPKWSAPKMPSRHPTGVPAATT